MVGIAWGAGAIVAATNAFREGSIWLLSAATVASVLAVSNLVLARRAPRPPSAGVSLPRCVQFGIGALLFVGLLAFFLVIDHMK